MFAIKEVFFSIILSETVLEGLYVDVKTNIVTCKCNMFLIALNQCLKEMLFCTKINTNTCNLY